MSHGNGKGNLPARRCALNDTLFLIAPRVRIASQLGENFHINTNQSKGALV